MDKVQKIREEVERIQLYTQSEVLKQVLDYINKVQEEPVSEPQVKESAEVQHVDKMCKENGNSLTQEPVSEDLESASEKYACRFSSSKYGHDKVKDAFIAGDKWKEEQMLKDAIDVKVKVDAGGYPYIPQIELYDYDKDVPLAKEGDKYKVVLIKEE